MGVVDLPSLVLGAAGAFLMQLFWIVLKLGIAYHKAKAADTPEEWDDRFWRDAEEIVKNLHRRKKP